MTQRPTVTNTLVSVALVVATVAGCTSDGPGATTPDNTEVGLLVEAATVPPERQTPFCQAMIELNSRLLNDPPDDAEAMIIDVYREIRPEVPVEIADDFEAVLEALEGGATPTTPSTTASTSPSSSTTVTDTVDASFDAEPFELSTPAERLNDYVRFACQDTANNPGPPPTQPREQTDDSDDDG